MGGPPLPHFSMLTLRCQYAISSSGFLAEKFRKSGRRFYIPTLNKGGWGPAEGVLVVVSSWPSYLLDVEFCPFVLLAKFLPSTVVSEGVSHVSSPPTGSTMRASLRCEYHSLAQQKKPKYGRSKIDLNQFEIRLNRAACNLPSEFINKSIEDLARRCFLMHEAKGGFLEGVRSQRPL